MTETTVKIEFATLAEADAFNADLKQSLARVREAIGSTFATVIAPGGIDDGAKHMRKLNGVVWLVARGSASRARLVAQPDIEEIL